MYLFYSIIYIIALCFLLPFEYVKRPKAIRKRWIRERFGFVPLVFNLQSSACKTIWIHAVSVGEVIASISLIKKIKDKLPSSRIIVSTVTDTGQKVATERLGSIAEIIYAPFDIVFAIKNLIKRVNPSFFIVMETELWPNAIRIMSENGIAVCLMNGRISNKSFKGYKKLSFFIKDVLNRFSLLCVQNEEYAERLKLLGAESKKIKVVGSFKFDTRPSEPAPEWTKVLIGKTIIAGSTHRTEEDLVINVYTDLKFEFPDLNLIVAPRHPERFKEVMELLQNKGLKHLKRSEITPLSRYSGVIVLLDVIGELSSVYGACDIAVMGGSFIPHGGQNPLEPAYWGKAIVCGPHMENFPFMDEFYKSGAALKVAEETLALALKALLQSPEKAVLMGKAARRLYEKNSGAVDKAMKEIEGYL